MKKTLLNSIERIYNPDKKRYELLNNSYKHDKKCYIAERSNVEGIVAYNHDNSSICVNKIIETTSGKKIIEDWFVDDSLLRSRLLNPDGTGHEFDIRTGVHSVFTKLDKPINELKNGKSYQIHNDKFLLKEVMSGDEKGIYLVSPYDSHCILESFNSNHTYTHDSIDVSHYLVNEEELLIETIRGKTFIMLYLNNMEVLIPLCEDKIKEHDKTISYKMEVKCEVIPNSDNELFMLTVNCTSDFITTETIITMNKKLDVIYKVLNKIEE